MRKTLVTAVLFTFSALLFIYAGCKSDDNPTTPSTGEVEMASVGFDSVSGMFAGSSITQTRNLGSSSLNFTDRDSTRITFSYKGANSGNDTLFFISGPSSARLYTLKDATVNDSYKTVNITVPSVKVNGLFTYTMKAQAPGGVIPYMVVKDLKVYKK